MGLIMDILRRGRQLRLLRGAEETPKAGRPSLNKQRKGISNIQWGFISGGLISLCILSVVLLKTYISPSTTQPDQAIVPGEGKSSPPTVEKKSSEAPKVLQGFPKEENSLNSSQALKRTESEEEGKERLSHGGAHSNSRPDHGQEERELYESEPLLSKKRQTSLTRKMPKEEIPFRFIGEGPQGARDMDFPIGMVISQGNVKMEVKDKVWRMLESPYSPILKEKKVKTENGTARISLSNNSLIEVSQNSLLSFEHEGRLNLLEGGIHFKIPATAQMNFTIGALSVTKPHSLAIQNGSTAALTREEDTEGSLFLHPDGSLRVRSVQGSLSILDHENRMLTAAFSNEPITITSKIVSGKEPWRVEHRKGVSAPEVGEKSLAPVGKEGSEVDDLEKYLIEFSIHLKGKELPPNLDAQKFFSILATEYPHPDIIEKVKQYPVRVRKEEGSYVLVLCDKQSEWMLYKDFGKTTDRVDYVLWPEGLTVRCREAFPLYWLLAIPVPAITAGVVWYELDRHDDHDHKDTIPLCP